MAVAYFCEWPGATEEMAQRVQQRINVQTGDAPRERAIFHADGEADGAYWTFDVWESEDAARRHYSTIRDPALEAEGIPLCQPRVLPVHWHSD